MASAGLSATDQDIVEDALSDPESLLDNVDDLKGGDILTTEGILDMAVDELDSDNDQSTRGFPDWREKRRSSLGLSLKQPFG